MRVAGIIAEYNPFHKGHQYHIEETKRQTGADYVVVVMSGDFVQRGEAAVVDKYMRSKMALLGGADVIIEMPAFYATASAEYFATAGVGILDAIGCVDFLSFGSEWADVATLSEIADILLEEPEIYKKTLKQKLEEGENFPKAREAAVVACSQNPSYGKVLDTPNHILGIEYIKALKRKNSKIKPCVIGRRGSGYHDDSWNFEEKVYPSATALRQILAKDSWQDIDKERLMRGIPYECEQLMEMIQKGDQVSWQDMMPLLDYIFLMKHHVLGKYFGMDYDLSQRIGRLYQPGHSFSEIMEICHSRNYTDAALRRVFLHLVLHMKDLPFLAEGGNIPIPYARILGFRKEAGKVLSAMREVGQIPVIQRPVEGKKGFGKNVTAEQIYKKDILCANLYEQIAARKAGRDYRMEYIRNPVIL